MWVLLGKKIARAGSQVARQVSNFADDLGESLIEVNKSWLLNDQDNRKNKRSLKIAILGLPNAGKSTLINHLVGRPVCAASKKIHTTRNKAAAICCVDDTQLVFIDTPGIVGRGEIKKYGLEKTFTDDTNKSIKQADVVGVMQDMTNPKSREYISDKLISLLKISQPTSNSILILNKVDAVKKKKILLDVVKRLTDEAMWPHFSDVFMISAKTGDGVEDLKNYFLDSAKSEEWNYDETAISDQPAQVIIQQLVKAKILENLPNELPYIVNIDIEHVDYYPDNSMNVVTRVLCPSMRIARLIIGINGERIKKIAREAEQELCKLFETSVRLRISVPISEKDQLQKQSVN